MKYLILIVAFTAISCSNSGAGKKDSVAAAASKSVEAVGVRTVNAEQRRVDKAILVTGSLLPDEIVTVVSEVPGKIVSIRVDFGQSIRKGEVIAEMDKTEFQLQLDRTKAALSQALARVGLDAAQPGQTPTSTPMMRQARAQMEDARFKYENAQKLVKSGDISQERFNELEKAYRARQAAVEATQDEMRTLWANVEALKAEVSLAEKRLRDATIRAPFDGAVSDRKVAPGQYVKDNVPVLTLVKTYPLRLRLEVPETAAGAVRVGTSLAFTTDAAAGASFHATVRELNPALNEQSRTLIAEARLNSADARLRPGMFVQVRLVLASGVAAVVVPKEAVYTVAGLTKIFVVENGKLAERRVAPGEMIGGWMEVPADQIPTGAPVVVGNLSQLSDGQPVKTL
ncbi:MAG: efflux RND transporter periplasmic adaptor subunit [Bryobacteraceae bacterium]|nr:efflux RND transporter periplasmic adaptor subunit [Bryobacteraceae bacterium]